LIARFTGSYRFLSNFWPARVELYGIEYPSVEHAYVAAKTLDASQREHIRQLEKPGDVKRYGRKLVLRPDWNDVRLYIMEDLVRQKFEDPELRKLLLATGDQKLIEGNTWGDRFWGVCDGVGENHLGRILMRVRAVCLT